MHLLDLPLELVREIIILACEPSRLLKRFENLSLREVNSEYRLLGLGGPSYSSTLLTLR